jgi:hypothetical protein
MRKNKYTTKAMLLVESHIFNFVNFNLNGFCLNEKENEIIRQQYIRALGRKYKNILMASRMVDEEAADMLDPKNSFILFYILFELI